jgi:hypothetical protein
MFTQNAKERIAYILFLFQESFKVLVACLLSIFVPQFCSDTGTTCTFKQNFENLSSFNEFVIFFNFFTLAVFTYMYYLETYREFYFIKKLDNNPSFPSDYLETALTAKDFDSKEALEEKQKISASVQAINKKYYKTITITLVVFLINAISSAVLIFYFFYDGFRSVSTLVSNLLLVSTKLYKNWNVLHSNKYLSAISTSMLEPVGYNSLDNKLERKLSSLVVEKAETEEKNE